MREKNKINNNPYEIDYQFGKLPPQDAELEKIILGAYILESDSFYNHPCNPEIFYKEEHQKICTAIKHLSDSGSDIDLMTVSHRLKATEEIDKVGGPVYLAELIGRVASSAHLEFHLSVIKQLHTRRSLIHKASLLQNKCYDLEDFEPIQKSITEINESLVDSSDENIAECSEVLIDLDKRIQENQTRTSLMTGIPTGIAKFDKFSYGMQKGDLIVIGAQSSQGKTSLALTIANNSTGRFGSKGAIFNLEMTNEQVMARMISQATGLNSKDLLNKKLNKDEYELYNEGLGHFNERELFLVKNSSISYERLSATIRKLKIKKDIDFVVVDFLQRLRPSQGMTKVDFYAYVAQKLKDIALELGIVIILLSQLNRDKDRPEPTMDRLRSSGEIEEAADTILLLWRPEYYKIDDIEYKGTSISSHGLAWMKIEKGRNIGTGEILLKFHPSTTKFEDYEEENRVDVESYNPHAGFESRDLEHENDLPF